MSERPGGVRRAPRNSDGTAHPPGSIRGSTRVVANAGNFALPTPRVISYAERVLTDRYHVPKSELADLIGQALLDCFAAKKQEACASQDGLFLVIAQRRGCDFWRRRRFLLPLEAASSLSCEPDQARLESESIVRVAVTFTLQETRLDARRVARIVRGILTGLLFEEACRAANVPRGSRGRYRTALRRCFRPLAESRHSRLPLQG